MATQDGFSKLKSNLLKIPKFFFLYIQFLKSNFALAAPTQKSKSFSIKENKRIHKLKNGYKIFAESIEKISVQLENGDESAYIVYIFILISLASISTIEIDSHVKPDLLRSRISMQPIRNQ